MNKLKINNNILDIQKIEYIKKNEKVTFKKNNLLEGLNITNDFFINKSKESYKIFDRVCDHNGGKLIYRRDLGYAICPFHNWKIDAKNGEYKNLNLKKKIISYTENEDEISLNHKKTELNKNEFLKNYEVEIQFLNHASLYFKSNKLKFVTDPWFVGPAFNCGWWLKKPTPDDCYNLVEECDFIFISHNHPDHLHVETLNKISKNKRILTPNFNSKSTIKLLEDLNFKNIELVEFDKNYISVLDEIRLSFLKSGDFRDDSGMFLQLGSFSALLNVDCNYLNFYKLPKNITILASSFAGGASGYPLCFENISDEEKKKIINQNKNVMLAVNQSLLNKTNSDFFLPYAGFFQENANRDFYIKENNSKNTIQDYLSFFEKQKIKTKILDVEKYQIFKFRGNLLQDQMIKNNKPIQEDRTEIYIKEFKKNNQEIHKDEIVKYFENSGYIDKLVLNLVISNDDFSIVEKNIVVDFSTQRPKVFFRVDKDFLNSYEDKKKLLIKIRKEAFVNTLKNKLPWDDLLIGFQVRISRNPDIYNNNFWFYFSNIYIGEKYIRQSINNIDCNICEKFSQSLSIE